MSTIAGRSWALVAAWREATDLLAIVLNDCTMADVLLGLGEEDAWLAVQLKTTGGAKKTKARNKYNSWEFCQVTVYSGIAGLIHLLCTSKVFFKKSYKLLYYYSAS